MFAELVNVCGNSCVRYFQNFRHAAIIHFDLEHLRIRITLWKFENILEVGAAPRVDRLRVIAHHHHVVMIPGEQINEISLDFVRAAETSIMSFATGRQNPPSLSPSSFFRSAPERLESSRGGAGNTETFPQAIPPADSLY